MAKLRNIIKQLDTDYFENVTPIWAKPYIVGDGLLLELWKHMPHVEELSWHTPEQRKFAKDALRAALRKADESESRLDEIWIEEIHRKYHNAAYELARWKPEIDGWERDSWANHSDNVFFRVREQLIATCEAWRSYDWQAFSKEHQRLKANRNDRPVWINEFHFSVLPDELPPPATLMGLCLADIVAQFGNGRAAQKVRHGPIKFDIIGRTPWKAILEFVQVVFDEDVDWDNLAIRTSVAYHAKRITQFYRTPHR